MQLTLRPVETRRLYRQIADQIRALIAAGVRAAMRCHMDMTKKRYSKEWKVGH